MLSLKRAHKEDIPFLLELRKASMILHLENQGIFLSEEEHLNIIRENFDCIRLIYKHETVVGMIKKIDREASFEILQFQLLPAHQGKGIGRRLLKDIISKAQKNNKSVKLNVLKKNPAFRLYKQLGFEVIGEDKLEYFMKI